MSQVQLDFAQALEAALRASNSGIGGSSIRLGTFGLGQRFMEIVKKVFNSVDISAITKEEFLAVVSTAFDKFIAPMLMSAPMGIMITPLVKALVMNLAGKFYDNRKKA
jgi:hypothetical protein